MGSVVAMDQGGVGLFGRVVKDLIAKTRARENWYRQSRKRRLQARYPVGRFVLTLPFDEARRVLRWIPDWSRAWCYCEITGDDWLYIEVRFASNRDATIFRLRTGAKLEEQ